jgi:D-methionine transport system permease protein
MLDSKWVSLLLDNTWISIYMTLISTVIAYVIGLPLGVLLVVTAPGGLRENKGFYKVLDFVVNIVRSVPFLILLITIMPLTKLIVGKSYGPVATIVPLALAAAPFVARLVESSLLEVDHGVIEAAQSMGAGLFTIIFKVLLAEARTSLIVGTTIALGTILGYSAMAGVVGGGGLGNIAIQYGYYRNQLNVMYAAVIILIIIVQVLQVVGIRLSKRLDRRNTR